MTIHPTPRSSTVTLGKGRAPARAMLRAMGLDDEDMLKPQIGVASSWNEVTPCNLPLDRLAKRAKVAVRDAGGVPFEFVTIAVSDGISMGHEGMRASFTNVPHMHLYVIYPVLIAFCVGFLSLGLRNFRRRVLS